MTLIPNNQLTRRYSPVMEACKAAAVLALGVVVFFAVWIITQ